MPGVNSPILVLCALLACTSEAHRMTQSMLLQHDDDSNRGHCPESSWLDELSKDYTKIKCLGSGVQGTVWLASAAKGGQQVAVKIATGANQSEMEGAKQECLDAKAFYKRDTDLFMNCIAMSEKYQVYSFMGSMNLQDVNTVDRTTDSGCIAGLREGRMSYGLPNFLQEFKDSVPLSLAEKKQVVHQTLQMCEAMLRKPALLHTDLWAENFVIRKRDSHGIKIGAVDYGFVQDCSNVTTCQQPHFFDDRSQLLSSSDMLRYVTGQIFIPLMVQDPWTTLFRNLAEARAGPLVAEDWSDANRRSLSLYKVLCMMFMAVGNLPHGIEETPDLQDPDGQLWHEAWALINSPGMSSHGFPINYFGTALGQEVPDGGMSGAQEIQRLGLDEAAVLHEIVPSLRAPPGYWKILRTLLVAINMGILKVPPAAEKMEAIIESQRALIDDLVQSHFFA